MGVGVDRDRHRERLSPGLRLRPRAPTASLRRAQRSAAAGVAPGPRGGRKGRSDALRASLDPARGHREGEGKGEVRERGRERRMRREGERVHSEGERERDREKERKGERKRRERERDRKKERERGRQGKGEGEREREKEREEESRHVAVQRSSRSHWP
jgi:hypothetical protein